MKMSENKKTSEVSHSEATELFLAIEEMEWRDAFDIIRLDPNQARTWVNNSGSGTITSWRRLPIHEACIRRAPVWLISELLSAFPESSSLSTNHGELPLHLAVDKACAPEVVNLIIVANWNAIVARDHAGRTALDIITHDEMLIFDSTKVVFENLKRCHETYMAIQKSVRDEKTILIRKQTAQTHLLTTRHQEELKKKEAQNVKLLKETELLKNQIKYTADQTQEKDEAFQKHVIVHKKCVQTIVELEEKVAQQNAALEREKALAKELQRKLKQKEKEIQSKNLQIDTLSNDLQNVVTSNETEILDSLIQTEQSMREMVSAQIALQKLMASKSEGLKSILTQRGIDIPQKQTVAEEKEEEKSLEEQDGFVVDGEVINAAMVAAATAALKANF